MYFGVGACHAARRRSSSSSEMRAKARRQLRDKERGLIIVDYLQLMQPTKARRIVDPEIELGQGVRRAQDGPREDAVPSWDLCLWVWAYGDRLCLSIILRVRKTMGAWR